MFCSVFFVDAKRINSCNCKDAKRIIMGSNSTFIKFIRFIIRLCFRYLAWMGIKFLCSKYYASNTYYWLIFH